MNNQAPKAKEEKKTLDHEAIFALEASFPDAAGAFFSGYKGVAICFTNAIFVLDTNVLLMPYSLGNSSVNELKKVYEKLISEERLFIPERVAREYAKNRTGKLAEIYATLINKKSGKLTRDVNYPIINDLPEHAAIVSALVAVKEAEKKYEETLDALMEKVRGWEWNDPVSSIYSELFTFQILCSHGFSDAEITAMLLQRYKNKLPPGYKDAAKDDGGIGDLAIWLSALKLGEKHLRPLIFVSEDSKADWWQNAAGGVFLPRYELVDEYRRASKGQTLHIIKPSKLLELFQASTEAVKEALKVEHLNHMSLVQLRERFTRAKDTEKRRFQKLNRSEKIAEILHWFHANYVDPAECCPYESREGGYLWIWGGPYDARDEIEEEFGGIASDAIVDEVVERLEDSCSGWSGHPSYDEEDRDPDCD